MAEGVAADDPLERQAIESVRQGDPDAYDYLVGKYALLPHGASMGDKYGPILVSRHPVAGGPGPRSLKGMKIAILTREFPPDVYGGAGVHVDFLVRELHKLLEVEVHCMGEPRAGAIADAARASRPPVA